MAGTVLAAGARTPIGKLSGGLSSFSAAQLGGFAIAEALKRAGITGDQVDMVIMGHVIEAGAGQITARQAAVAGGIPMSVPATTVNKVCLSGLNAIYLADLMINAGEADIIVAGGMESMTQAPYLLPGARAGYRLGDNKVIDSMMFDGLTCAFDNCAMGLGTDRYNQKLGVSRERQDEFAAGSHAKAAAAIASGKMAEEIVVVQVPQRKGDPILFSTDEGVRVETDFASLQGLRPAFDKEGTITAGNASQISDGGAAMVIMSKKKASSSPTAKLLVLTLPCSPSLRVPSKRRCQRPTSRSPTLTCSSSTKPSQPLVWLQRTNSASPRTRSTSMVEQSHLVTRSACRVPVWH